MIDPLLALCSQTVLSVGKQHYFGDELQALFIQTTSGVVLKIESCEVESAPFEAYSLCFTLHSGDGRSWPDYEIVSSTMKIDHIEIFRREEWVDSESAPPPTIGINPVSIDAGPIGSSPPGSTATTVISGCAFHSAASDSALLWIFMLENPGLIGISNCTKELDECRHQTTSQTVC
jgi:hypothetical protein